MKNDFTLTWNRVYKRMIILLSSSRLAIPLLLATLVGIVTSLIAVGFIKCIEFNEATFFGKGKEYFSFLGIYSVVLIPAIGGLIVGPIVTFFAPEAKGHGVPEVMKAIAIKGGKIRPVVVIAKVVSSAIAIGTGASVGREGPIVQVGSGLGSSVGQIFKLSESRIKNLIACGAAAGIAAVFNAPIAGVMFSLEVILRDFGARALSTVVVAAVSSSIISRIFLGESPAFIAPAYSLESPYEIFLYLLLGIIAPLIAILFISVLLSAESVFEKWKFPDWAKPAVGGLIIGLIGVYFPQIFGSGLHTIENALLGGFGLATLLSLVLIKIFATSISLASGTSGGVFAPALFIGAVFGGALGKIFSELGLPFDIASAGAYAIAGMASVFSAAAHAPVTAILIVFEMTGDYQMILPIMVAVVISTSISQIIHRESIYTVKLKKKGIDISKVEEAKYLSAIQVRDAMTDKYMTVENTLPAKELISLMSQNKGKAFFVVNSENELKGYVKPKKAQETLFDKDAAEITVDEITSPVPGKCFPDDPLNDASVLMMSQNTTQLPVVDPLNPKAVIGVLKSEDIFKAYTNITTRRDDLLSRAETLSSDITGTVQLRFTVLPTSKFVDKQIKEIDVPDGVVLTSIQRKGMTLIPEGHTQIEERDKIWAVVIPEHEKEFRDWLKDNDLRVSSLFR